MIVEEENGIKITSFLIGQVSSKNGKHIVSYWISLYQPAYPGYGKWAFWRQGNWVNDKPKLTPFGEIEKKGLMGNYLRVSNEEIPKTY